MTKQMGELNLTRQITDHVFSYERHDTHQTYYWNTSLLERIRLQRPHWFKRITLDIIPQIYDLVLLHRGIEEPHIAALSNERMEEPGLGLFFNDNDQFVLVDGNHRLVKRYRRGLKQMDVWTTVEPVWSLCNETLPPMLRELLDSERPAPSHEMVKSLAVWRDRD